MIFLWTQNWILAESCGHKMKKWVKVVDTKPICGHKNGHEGLTLWTQNELVDTKLNGKNCGHKMRVGAKIVDRNYR